MADIAIKAGQKLICGHCKKAIGYYSKDQEVGQYASVNNFISEYEIQPHTKMLCPACGKYLVNEKYNSDFHNVFLENSYVYFEKEYK